MAAWWISTDFDVYNNNKICLQFFVFYDRLIPKNDILQDINWFDLDLELAKNQKN